MNTFIISDLHLFEEETSSNPLWKTFKRKKYFFDNSLKKFINKISNYKDCTLVLNGDILDFDSIMRVPSDPQTKIKPYEYDFGLNPMEWKSVYKIEQIFLDHLIFFNALEDFIKKGNKVVFVIGNHDLELMWIGVQEKIRELLNLNEKENKNLVFCEWFYITNNTLIEHGHQYDPYCMCTNPINPIIKKNGLKIRLPFGNLANRFMVNQMGLKNPHNDESYTKNFKEYVKFFLKYELRVQPFMIWTWFSGAIKTFIYSFGEYRIPSLKDPLTYHDKIEKIAKKSNATEKQVLMLLNNHAHPAVRKPLILLRELWLDRAFLLISVLFISWFIFSSLNVFSNFPYYWFFVSSTILLPMFLYYAHGVSSDIHENQYKAEKHIPVSAKICNVKRVVLGHTHNALHKNINDIEYLNTGTWSRIFKDVECTQEFKKESFVWINNNDASLYEWIEESEEFIKIPSKS